MTLSDEDKALLRDLFAILKKHNVSLSGCGCCNTPSVGGLDVVCIYPDKNLVSVDYYEFNAETLEPVPKTP